MKAISATLEAHQQGLARVPSVRVIARPERWGVALARWTRYYTGSENDSPHACVVAGDGSLVRARNDAGTLYVSRVASPGAGSTYSSWTNLATITSGLGLSMAANAGEIILCYLNNGGLRLAIRTSTDNGATWSGETAIRNEVNAFTATSIALKAGAAGADAEIFAPKQGVVVRIQERIAGVWIHRGNWPRGGDIASITGAAAMHDGVDYHFILTGTVNTTLEPMVYSYLVGDAGFPDNQWSSPATVAIADVTSGTTFHRPHIAPPAGVDFRVSWTASEAGNVAVDRVYTAHTPTSAAGNPADWSEAEPYEALTLNGLAIAAQKTDQLWGTTADGVWFADLGDSAELTELLEEMTLKVGPFSARARLVFTNDDGALLGLPNATYPGLVTGGTVEIAPGYGSGAGGVGEYGVSNNLAVKRIAYESAGGHARVVVELDGHWERLAGWRASQAVQIAAGVLTRNALFGQVVAKVAIRVSGSGSSDWFTLTPGFAIAPGESGLTAARRLLAVAEVVALVDGDTIDIETLDEVSDYTYSASDHPIAELASWDEAPPTNWLRLQGPDRYADAHSFASIYRDGAALRQLRNLEADSDVKASAFADAALDRDLREQVAGVLRSAVNAGQQIYDVVTVADADVGVSAVKYRVMGIELRYSRAPAKRAVYDQVLALAKL